MWLTPSTSTQAQVHPSDHVHRGALHSRQHELRKRPMDSVKRMYTNIEEYYAADEQRRRSGEADYGVQWRLKGWDYQWRVSYVHNTGEGLRSTQRIRRASIYPCHHPTRPSRRERPPFKLLHHPRRNTRRLARALRKTRQPALDQGQAQRHGRHHHTQPARANLTQDPKRSQDQP